MLKILNTVIYYIRFPLFIISSFFYWIIHPKFLFPILLLIGAARLPVSAKRSFWPSSAWLARPPLAPMLKPPPAFWFGLWEIAWPRLKPPWLWTILLLPPVFKKGLPAFWEGAYCECCILFYIVFYMLKPPPWLLLPKQLLPASLGGWRLREKAGLVWPKTLVLYCEFWLWPWFETLNGLPLFYAPGFWKLKVWDYEGALFWLVDCWPPANLKLLKGLWLVLEAFILEALSAASII